MTEYIVVYNLNEENHLYTQSRYRNITKTALKLALSPYTVVQELECRSGWLVRIDLHGDIAYLCFVSSSNIYYRGKSNLSDLLHAAENLIYWTPSSEISGYPVTVDDYLLKGIN